MNKSNLNSFHLFHTIGSCLQPNRTNLPLKSLCRSGRIQEPANPTNLALDFLCRSGRIEEAASLFDGMPHRNEFAWSTMISAYARDGRMPDALALLDASPHRDTTTFLPWSSLISGYSYSGRGPQAVDLFRQMLARGLRPDQYAMGSVLRACSAHSYLSAGQLVHALAVKSRFDEHVFVVAGLVDMYAKCRRVNDAARLFDAVPPPDWDGNHVLWTVMVAGHARNGNPIQAVRLFRFMRSAGVAPNQFTFPSVLAACAAAAGHAPGFGAQVHGCVVRGGFEDNLFVRSSLVDMYSKCGDLTTARKVLEASNKAGEDDDVVSWNSLIAGCARRGPSEEALALFVKMRQIGLGADEFTYPSVLNSLASGGSAEDGRSVHCLLLKSGLEEGYLHVGNALVDMYAKCGRLDCARAVFDKMRERDVVTWTSLINGCARGVSHEEALWLFCEMRAAGVDSDEFLIAGVLSSCAALTALELGRQLHGINVRRGFDSFLSVGNALVSMYAKNGCVEEAHWVFDSTSEKDTITWTALIVGYAQNGRGRESLRLYDRMLLSGARPDYVTFIGVLFACSHAGLEEDGQFHFESMERDHRVRPGPEHYACMIDLLGRSGKTSEAAALLDRMGFEPDATVWKALLGACRVHGNVQLAERAAEMLFEMEPRNAAPYVLLSNAYSASGRWSDVARIRTLMRSRGVSKEPGCSWMEVGREVHVFHAGDRRHARTAEIYAKVEEMMTRIKAEAGYVADTAFALHDAAAGEEEGGGKEADLAHHSEKLAVAFGLLSVPRGAHIRVFKNLRICGDCHRAVKLVGEVFEREIVVRDANCFHHFKDGECSCGDYW